MTVRNRDRGPRESRVIKPFESEVDKAYQGLSNFVIYSELLIEWSVEQLNTMLQYL